MTLAYLYDEVNHFWCFDDFVELANVLVSQFLEAVNLSERPRKISLQRVNVEIKLNFESDH